METIQVIILQASDGHWLYNGDVFGRAVQLAPSASADDWREVTDAEKEELERQLEEDAKREFAE